MTAPSRTPSRHGERARALAGTIQVRRYGKHVNFGCELLISVNVLAVNILAVNVYFLVYVGVV